jgi:hypothetical protein
MDLATVIILHGKIVSLASHPQAGSPGPWMYIPRQVGLVIFQESQDSLFRRLLRLAGLRWSIELGSTRDANH